MSDPSVPAVLAVTANEALAEMTLQRDAWRRDALAADDRIDALREQLADRDAALAVPATTDVAGPFALYVRGVCWGDGYETLDTALADAWDARCGDGRVPGEDERDIRVVSVPAAAVPSAAPTETDGLCAFKAPAHWGVSGCLLPAGHPEMEHEYISELCDVYRPRGVWMWLGSRNARLGGEVPAALMATPEGRVRVREEIDRLAGGPRIAQTDTTEESR